MLTEPATCPNAYHRRIRANQLAFADERRDLENAGALQAYTLRRYPFGPPTPLDLLVRGRVGDALTRKLADIHDRQPVVSPAHRDYEARRVPCDCGKC